MIGIIHSKATAQFIINELRFTVASQKIDLMEFLKSFPFENENVITLSEWIIFLTNFKIWKDYNDSPIRYNERGNRVAFHRSRRGEMQADQHWAVIPMARGKQCKQLLRHIPKVSITGSIEI